MSAMKPCETSWIITENIRIMTEMMANMICKLRIL
jgi:hypothetical protein